MRSVSILLLLALGALGISSGEPGGEEGGPRDRLMWFLGDEERNKSLLPLIEQLDEDSYAVREAASAKLADLPLLPAFVRRMAKTDDRPEVRLRLRELAKLRPVEKETGALNGILGEIAKDEVSGLLGALSRIVETEVWSPDNATLEVAARTTVVDADLALLKELTASPSVVLRRLAAAAYGGLPGEKSNGPLRGLSEDVDDSVALLAASELAAQGAAACLAALARLLDSDNFYVRHRSWSALQGLSGRAFGYDPSADAEDRRTASRSWREWAGGSEARITGELPDSSVIVLFNGRDFTGWTVYENGQAAADQTTWTVEEGVLVTAGKGRGDIRTTTAFEDYVLTLQYKIEIDGGDGGVGVMLTKEGGENGAGLRGDGGNYLEIQLLPGRTGDFYKIGQFQAQAGGKPLAFSGRREVDVPDPAGKWHTMKVTVRDGEIEVALNGTVVNRATKGPEAPGKILLRNEGKKISYKDLVIHPVAP